MSPELRKRLFLVLFIVTLLIAFRLSGLHEIITLEELQRSHSMLVAYYEAHPLWSLLWYMILYTLLTAFSVPGAVILTLGGAAVFGFWPALFVVSIASTAGAVLACIVARYVLRDWVIQKFDNIMPKIDAGIKRDGAWYLFSIRLVPIFPFFVVNLLMGLTSIPLRTYAWASQLGMLPGTAIYVYAGQELARIRSVQDIFSIEIMIAFTLVALFPLVARYILAQVRIAKQPKTHSTSIER